MWIDPVVDEVHRARKQLLANAKGNLRSIIDDAMARQKKSGRKVLPAAPRQPELMMPVKPGARKRQAA